MLKLYIDTARESILLPIYGQQVPFHISTIKTVTKNEDNLRINFKLPDGQQAGDQKDFMDPKATFVKEMTFRITNQNEYELLNHVSHLSALTCTCVVS